MKGEKERRHGDFAEFSCIAIQELHMHDASVARLPPKERSPARLLSLIVLRRNGAGVRAMLRIQAASKMTNEPHAIFYNYKKRYK